MEELLDWTVCGRAIGQATGWDQSDTFVMQLYNFHAAEGYKGPAGECVSFDFERGTVEAYDEDGNVTQSVDLIEAIRACPATANNPGVAN